MNTDGLSATALAAALQLVMATLTGWPRTGSMTHAV